jgi:hypothetical protein
MKQMVEEDFETAEQWLWYRRFNAGYAAFREVLDMPDRRAQFFVQHLMANGGKLPAEKRGDYKELTDAQIAAFESIIAEAIDEFDNPATDEGVDDIARAAI